jgi:hypothetical protein
LKELKISDRDYIDIYKINHVNEILNKIRKPIPFCRYCDILHSSSDEEWGRSNKELKEWI